MTYWKEGYFPVILIVLNIVLTLLIFDPRLFTGGDNATFIITARSLLDGQGYKDLSNPDTPVFIGSPPGYPVFLAFLMLIFGKLTDVIVFKLASVLLSCITLYYFYKLLKLSSDNKTFVSLTSLFVVVNFSILYPNQLEISDVLFNAFLFSSLYFFGSGKKYGELTGIILAVLATYTRYAGIVLVLALLAYLLFHRRIKKFCFYGLLSLSLILPWAIYIIGQGFTLTDIMTGAPYAAQRKLLTLNELFQRWGDNFRTYFLNSFPRNLFSWQLPPVWIGIVATIVWLCGFLWRIRSKISALEIYVILYIMLILSWPQVWSGERYVLPIVYFVVFYFSFTIFKVFKPKLFLITMSLLMVYNAWSIFKFIPVTRQLFQAYRQGDLGRYYPPEWQAFFQCCDWIKENLPREAVIVSRKPNMLYFQAGNRGFVYPFSSDKELVYQRIRQADYVLLDRFTWTSTTQHYLYPAMLAHQEEFETVYAYPSDKVYVVKVKK